MKKLLLLVFCILLLVPLALAIPPFDTTVVGSVSGLTIVVPVGEFIVQNQNISANVHVYNTSDGVLMKNDTVSCEIHIYNITGHHMAAEQMGFDDSDGDFVTEFDGAGNFSEPGLRTFIIQCNTSLYGGVVQGTAFVTKDGNPKDKTDTSSGISATIFILFIVTLLFVMPFVKQFSKFEWANNIFKRAFWTVGVFVLMWNSSILSTIADNANLDIVSHLFRYMIMFGWAGYILAGYMVLKSLFEMLGAWRVSKEKKRSGEDEDGE